MLLTKPFLKCPMGRLGRKLTVFLAMLTSAISFHLSRNFAYGADGGLDLTFGTGGKVVSDFGGSEFASVIAVQSTGKIIVGGSRFGPVILARYESTGSLDTTFGSNGTVTNSQLRFASLLVQNDDRIVVVGFGQLIRYDVSGSLDTTFGNAGTVITDFTSGGLGAALQPDGKILVVGAGATSADFAIARYNSDGTTIFHRHGGIAHSSDPRR